MRDRYCCFHSPGFLGGETQTERTGFVPAANDEPAVVLFSLRKGEVAAESYSYQLILCLLKRGELTAHHVGVRQAVGRCRQGRHPSRRQQKAREIQAWKVR